MPIYKADDLDQPGISLPESGFVRRPFKATIATMLATTSALGFIASDVIMLAPIPGGCVLDDYFIDVPSLDTATNVTLNLGDNDILSGAVTGVVSGAQTTPAAPATTFVLTLAASSTSFQTTGLVMVGGIPIAHTGKSGSTLTGCTSMVQSAVLPDGATVQEAGNIGKVSATGFNNVAVIGQNAAGIMAPWGNGTATTFTAATRVAGSLPKYYSQPYNTGFGTSLVPISGKVGPLFFLMQINATPTGNPTYTTAAIRGWIGYHAVGYSK